MHAALAELVPDEKALDIGCGAGIWLLHLAKNREVLSIDNNQRLIDLTMSYIKQNGTNCQIHKCDLFSISASSTQLIREFGPQIITARLIGTNGIDLLKNTPEEPNLNEKGKLYRKKIEDAIVSNRILVESADAINFANRSSMVAGISEAERFQATKEDYDKYVFSSVEFEVFQVKFLTWPLDGSNFLYASANNPNLARVELTPVIFSLSACRR